MDLTSLLSYRPSLTDYLNGGKSTLFDSVSQGLNAKVEAAQAKAMEAMDKGASGDNVELSEEAKTMIDLANKDNKGNLTGTQKAAQNFMMGFFDQSGLKLADLTDPILDFIEGLNGVIAGSNATTRDVGTDSMEAKLANGDRKAYTLTGANSRLRIAIEYGQDGKPTKLSITDISGGEVETADITFKTDADGKQSLNVERSQREYKSGHLVKLDEIPALSMALYKA
jgi:hypothetical protein